MSTNGGGSKRFVSRTLRGESAPRPVAGPLAVHYCATVAGVTLRQYTTDSRVLSDSIIRYYETFRPDAVWISADTWVTAEAMGASVGFTRDDQPPAGMGDPLIRTRRDIDRIPPADPSSQGRMPLMLQATRFVIDALGGDAFIVSCFDQYPFSLACALMGIDEAMLRLVGDGPMVEALMERCLEYGAAYAKALAGCGADLLSGGDSPAGLIGPRRYRETALPFEKRLIEQLHAEVNQPVSLHICGDSTGILGDMVTSGADVLEIDHRVDLGAACEAVGPAVGLWGNLDPVALLSRGTSEEVAHAARGALRAAESCGHGRFVLSSGCTLAPDTPPENLHALLRVVSDWPTEGDTPYV